ncbi:MAG: hypothetical protein NFCOHLIN_02863 [Gammaproteobacteria bacterium]|nr:hypothetical protein [Gammaproteobacteria bacterium]
MASANDFTLRPDSSAVDVEKCVRRYGAVVLPGFACGKALEDLRREYRALLDDRDGRYIYKIDYEAGTAVSMMRKKVPNGAYPAIDRFFGDRRLMAVARRYIGYPCLVNYEIYATHEYRPEANIAPTHFDKLWTLKFMLYLNDVDRDNGAFGVIPESAPYARAAFRSVFDRERLKSLSMGDDRYQKIGNDQVPEGLGPVVDITAPAGTLIVFDTDTYHHAGTVAVGKERMILRGHCGPRIVYSRVRKGSRQWWRGERPFSMWDAFVDRVSEMFS